MRRALTMTVLLELLLPAVARADVPPPPEPPNPCADKQAGDSCSPSGVCKEGECCKRAHVSATLQHYESMKPLDQQDMDIVNPREVCSPCLRCEVASSTPVVEAKTAPVETKTTPAVEAKATPATTPQTEAKSSGCAFAGTGDGTGLLAVALLGLELVRRRRAVIRRERQARAA
ncbi:hypothetical protein [Nannocystis bainbridge]|uniref:MYXO-CTERM domain-containing protein n=1 Tax=Nannocystis bainbridge TaxID=2995303 RepID=A0ABT5E795_9BACT|nr:hypothetical protein [Nannocystis bainbridge]MDC0721545.1 hypothetical protein [Nannocystis bainbridge]